MEPREIIFEGVDSWGRPVFKDQFNYRYGSVNKLFYGIDGAERVAKEIKEDDLLYFGNSFDEDDPIGAIINPKKIKIVKQFTNEQSTI